LQGYVQNAPALYAEESKYQPMYNQLQQGIMGSNIGYYSNAIEGQMYGAQNMANVVQNTATQQALSNYTEYGGQTAQAALAASPELQALQGFGTQQLGATQNPTLQGILGQVQQQIPGQQQSMNNLAAQAGRMFDPTNVNLQNLSQQVGTGTGQAVSSMQDLAGTAAANQRSDIFKGTASTVMGQLGQLDPLTQQLSNTAQQQLALGGQVSQQGLQDAAQAARAAYSQRGMLNTSGSIASEVLNRDAVQQARLQQREQYASGVSGLVQQENQQRTANALGLTSTDIAATQANQQLASQLYQGAGQLGQAGAQIQGGLQGQIASNIGTAMQQQGALTQQGISNYQAAQQQAAGLQGSILDQLYRQQAQGASALQNVYGAQQTALSGIMGAPATGVQLATSIAGGVPSYGTGSPNLFQGSGMLQLTNQNQMAAMNAQASANQMNAQSKGASSGAMIGAIGSIGGALIGGVALF
jgi:hypothetical protein